MLQIIGLLLISWLIIWLYEKGNLSVLGIEPTKKRIKYFIILFFVSALISSTAFLLRIYFAEEEYQLNPLLKAKSVFFEIWFQFRSVFTEELICRGVLLYILIKKIGKTKAIILSSIIFAILHWFNSGVWGDLFQMAQVFIFTFSMGIVLAYSYAKTFSIIIPFAIHFGWNLIQNYIFPENSLGNHIFILAKDPPIVTISYLSFYTMFLLPKISIILANYFILKNHKQVEIQ